MIFYIFLAVFLGYNQYRPGGFIVLWFYVQEHPKAQLAVVLVSKRLRSRDHGLKSHPTDWEKPGIELATPVLQDIGLSLYTTAASQKQKRHDILHVKKESRRFFIAVAKFIWMTSAFAVDFP